MSGIYITAEMIGNKDKTKQTIEYGDTKIDSYAFPLFYTKFLCINLRTTVLTNTLQHIYNILYMTYKYKFNSGISILNVNHFRNAIKISTEINHSLVFY